MRRLFIIVLVLFLTACGVLKSAVTPQPTPEPSSTPLPSPHSTNTLSPTPFPSPTQTVTLTPQPTLIPTQTYTLTPLSTLGLTQTPVVEIKSTNGYTVHYLPDGGLYVGDLVSFEIIPPQGKDMHDRKVMIEVDPPGEGSFGPSKFEPFGIAGRLQATMVWVWDTQGLQPGQYTLTFTITPGDDTWKQSIILEPTSALPPPERQAKWASAKSTCCVLNYVTGTEGERDLPQLLKEADAQAKDVASKFGSSFTEPITVTLIPRVMGNGGFANNEISISYLDRDYAANRFGMVLHHEMVHIMDARLGGDLKPSILVEGLAVYLTGGHFKPEDEMERTAALLQLPGSAPGQGQGWYIPLKSLADAFYASQHEIGYIEGAAIVEYMVKTYGWEKYLSFYRDIHPQPDKSQSTAIDVALHKHFQISFDQLEKNFLAALESQPVSPALMDDVRLSVNYFDTMRRYQQILDPSAYFRTAWLLDNVEMRKRGIVADYLRHPSGPVNLELETLLIAANHDLVSGQYSETEKLLSLINNKLDELSQDSAGHTVQ